MTTSQALVRHIAREAQVLIVTMNGARPPLLPGYRLKYLDGNCLAASEHRLKPLRTTAAGPLPGKSLVVVDPQLNMAIDVFPCADGHTQERALLNEVIPTVEDGDVWVGDRNFCVLKFLFGIHRKQAFFIIRQHGNLTTNPLEKFKFIGASETGDVYDQAVQLKLASGETMILRRITVKLKVKTRNGDTERGAAGLVAGGLLTIINNVSGLDFPGRSTRCAECPAAPVCAGGAADQGDFYALAISRRSGTSHLWPAGN